MKSPARFCETLALRHELADIGRAAQRTMEDGLIEPYIHIGRALRQGFRIVNSAVVVRHLMKHARVGTPDRCDHHARPQRRFLILVK